LANIDALEAAQAALAACRASLSDAETDARHAGSRVEGATVPILAASVDRLLIEAQNLRERLDEKHAVLIWIRNLLPPGGDAGQRIAFALPPPPPPGVPAPAYPPPAEWIAAREALTRDANAALPL
jgi:hypothetical protein